jgi:hypothetical protein
MWDWWLAILEYGQHHWWAQLSLTLGIIWALYGIAKLLGFGRDEP